MGRNKKRAWKHYMEHFGSPRSLVKIMTITIIVGTMLLFVYYHLAQNMSYFRKWDLYTDYSVNSSIAECSEPSIETNALNQFLKVRVPKRQYRVLSASKQKLILLWTTYFGENYSNDYYFFQLGNYTFTSHMCPVSNCLVTNNRSLVRVADAIIFHLSDFNFYDLPTYRSASQLWIFYNLESPTTHPKNWYIINGLFNWTMSYREDSDVKAKYGEVCRLPRSQKKTLISRHLSQKKNYLVNKTGEVAWFVSNCYSSSNRQEYVFELSEYINVDIYGKCGNKTCLPVYSRHCYEDVLKSYKFYLAFENSICHDYVTEKFFNILNSDIVPIVMGGANYERIAPPKSYINVLDYPDPQKLAEYLKIIGNNSDLYNSYFEWKGKYKVYLYPWMCELCEKLHTLKDDNSPSIMRNSHDWWHEKAHCKMWYENRFLEMNSPTEYLEKST